MSYFKFRRVIIIIFLVFIFIIAFERNALSTNNEIESSKIIAEQKEIIKDSDFFSLSRGHLKDSFNNIDLDSIFDKLLSGEISILEIVPYIKDKVIENVKEVLLIISVITMIVIIHSLFKIISDNLENDSCSKITYFIQYILIVIFLMSTYSEVINFIRNTIENVISYSYLLIPILVSISASTGAITTSSMIEPVILYTISITGKVISSIIIPLLLISTALSIVSNVSDEIKLSKISKFLKSFSIWTLVFILTIFSGILSMQTAIGKSSDDLAIKSTKNIVSTAVPVVRESFK